MNTIRRVQRVTQLKWRDYAKYFNAAGKMSPTDWAALDGINLCPMEGIEPKKHNAICGLDQQGLTAVVAGALGYRAATDQYAFLKEVRFPREQVLKMV